MKATHREKIAAKDAKITALKQKLSRMRFKLALERMQKEDLDLDHAGLWEEKYRSIYNLETPGENVLAHIDYKRDLDTTPGMQMLRSGYLVAQRFKRLFEQEGATGLRSVLDFGCGCGRVTRFLDCLGPGTQIYGCDIDAEAIGWAQQHLPENYFVSGDRPPIPSEVERFGAAIVLSVFTHLPEDMQYEWLEELAERLETGALMMATFHGPSYHRFIPEADRETFERDGFVHSDLGRTPDLPDYYLSTFHSHEYIGANWTRHFKLRRICEQEIGGQDLAILEKI